MEKKDLKFYEAPEVDVVYLGVGAQILAGSGNPDDPFDDKKEDPEEV